MQTYGQLCQNLENKDQTHARSDPAHLSEEIPDLLVSIWDRKICQRKERYPENQR